MSPVDVSIPDSGPLEEASSQGKTPGRVHLLANSRLKDLNRRSDLRGSLQAIGHGAVLIGSGVLWGLGLSEAQWGLALPALVIYGISLATLFAPVHECVHRTAFASRWLNDGVAWIAGLFAFYNSRLFRYYHRWHHRYTQLPGQDPELSDPKPQCLMEYLVEISGWYWWIGRFQFFFRAIKGDLSSFPYIPASARDGVIRSMRLQVLIYGIALGISIGFGQPWFVIYWLLPMVVGQPVLRFILLAEHTGCTYDADPLTNTRTTLTLGPVRFLMWNMPFHAEHHLYPSIPFHALPTAHDQLRPHWVHLEPGYVQAHRGIIAGYAPSGS